MAKSSTGRHRADLPTLTPFTGVTETLTSAIATPVTAAGKGGLVVAVSSGLVAGVGLPASTDLNAARDAGTTTASIPLLTGADHAAQTATATASVAAPADAKVAFEHEAFRPVATHASSTATSTSRDVTEISRSLARNAYQAKVEAAQRAERARAAARAALVTPHRTVASKPAPVAKSTSVSTSSSRGASVVAIASRYLGVPYVYGGSSPRGFDCSGLTQYVYAQLGVSLPRTASAQYGATTRISRSQAQPGDLIFFFTGGIVTHVAIYLGGNMMLAAPHTGDVVKKQSIYSANIAFGRV